MHPKLNKKIILDSSGIFLLFALIFVFSQLVLAQDTSNFQIKDSYIEVQETDYPQNIALVKKENGKEEVSGQVKIIDQYLLSDLPENEFLDEYSYLKEGFQDLSISLETDQPLFDKENFYYSFSLLDKAELKMKSLLGVEAQVLPEYRIEKEVDKSHSVRTTLDFSTLTLDTNYKKTEEGYIKQTLTFKNNTNQDLRLNLDLEHLVNTEKIIWNKEEFEITQTPRSFDPKTASSISFYPMGSTQLATYNFSDTLSFDPQLWVFKKDSQNIVLLQLLVKVPANSATIIDPWYGFVGDKKYAWGENIGWLNLYPTDGKVYVATDCLKGYAWAENIGWINFGDGTPGTASDCDSGVHYANDSASDFGVNNDGSGNLYGYAWGENIGWLNFNSTHSQVVIDGSGNFSGYAWAENVGWIKFDHNQASYVPQTEWSPNTAPTVDSVSISPSPIDLKDNGTKTVTITATITDNDGCEDVFVNGSITGVFYDAAVEGDSCAPDDNDCYTSLTLTEVDNTCEGPGDYEAQASVDVPVWFIANPSSQWTAKVTATDKASESGSNTQTVTINTLRALDVTGGPINYGTLNPGGDTESINQEVTVYNVGNIACDVRLYGTDITWSGNIIDASYQEYSLSGFTYGAGNDLKEDPAYDDVNADLPKPTSHSPSNSSDIFYWGLGVPSPMPASDQYSGTNTFEVIDAL